MAEFSRGTHVCEESTEPSEVDVAKGSKQPAHSNPFDNIEHDVSEEQLETWNQMMNQVKGLVQMSDEEPDTNEEIFLDDSLLVSTGALEIDIPELTESKKQQEEPLSAQTSTSVPETSSGFNFDLSDSTSMDLTIQYLSGKITFLEFSELMEKMNDQGQPAEAPPVGEDMEVEDIGEVTEVTTEDMNLFGVGKRKAKEPRRKPSKRRKKRYELPKLLEKSMGEAVMTFAQGNHELAIQQCLEIIRQAPEASKPFQTLGTIYEDLGDMQKSLQYSLIAAYLDPSDTEEWVRLAEMCVEQNDVNQAIKCYTQAIHVGGENKMHCLWERSKLYEDLKEYKKALEGYQQLLPLFSDKDLDKYFKLAWAITRTFYEQGEKKAALETIQQAFKDHPQQITSEDVNLLLELQIPEKLYVESLEVFVKHCGVQFTCRDGSVWSSDKPLSIEDIKTIKFSKCEVPDLLPVDLRCKLAVCLIHQKHNKLIKDLIEALFEEDIEDYGDLYLDLAEAYMENSEYRQAEPLLKKLVYSTNYNLAAVWLRYGECLKAQGDLHAAVRAFSKVVAMAPTHIGARMSLSALQQQLGKHDEALEVLKHDELQERRMTKEEQQLLLQKCHLLNAQGKLDAFLSNAKQLLFQEWRDVEAEDMSYLQAIRTYKHRKETLLNHFESKGKDTIRIGTHLKMDRTHCFAIPFDDLWDMFKTLSEALIANKRYTAFEEITLLGMLCPVFNKDEETIAIRWVVESANSRIKRFKYLDKVLPTNQVPFIGDFVKIVCALANKYFPPLSAAENESDCALAAEMKERALQDFEWHILTAGILAKNTRTSYPFGRHFVLQNLENNQAWNMFMQVIMVCNDTRHNRFCLRKMLHEPNNIPLGIMNGHNSMATGSYKHSLGEYANVFRKTPTDPMISLCIGLDFIHAASQRFSAKRHYLVTQGVAFLNNYLELRGDCQETYYNLGRALHQINILYAAVHYYQKALEFPPCVGERGGKFDLTKEIAYNLSLVYVHSGSIDYAKYLLYKYCVI